MVFTEDDVENDGLIKREAGKTLNGVLARESGKLYSYFRDWCDKNDLDPNLVLGDMVLQSIRDEGMAQEISNTVVDLSGLKTNQVRKDDLELVRDLMSQFDEDDGDDTDVIDEMIERRIAAMGSGPLGGLGDSGAAKSKASERRIRELEAEIQQLKRQGQSGGGQPTNQSPSDADATVEVDTDNSESTDDLFEKIEGDSEEPEPESEPEPEVEVVDKGANDEPTPAITPLDTDEASQ